MPDLPAAISSLLSLLDETSEESWRGQCIVWSSADLRDGQPWVKRYSHFWETHYPAIIACGGTCIREFHFGDNTPARDVLKIVYPACHAYARHLFDEIHFGIDDFAAAATGEHPDRNANSPERILARRREAVKIMDEMALEHSVALISISPRVATIGTAEVPPREFGDRWGKRLWDFYDTYYAREAVDHPVHSFTKKECMRLARKHGYFLLGGYG